MGGTYFFTGGRRLALAGTAALALAALTPPAFAAASAFATRAGIITTVAGGPGGPGLATRIALTPTGVSYASGRVYVSEGVVQAVNTSTGWLTTAAGGLSGYGGSLGDGGLSRDATMDAWAAATDSHRNVVIDDEADNLIRVAAVRTGTFYGKAMTAGHIYAVAGNGRAGFSGDGGPATKARLNSPDGLTVDHAGNLVIADGSNNRVRVVAVTTGTFYGQPMTAGDIYTVAGGGTGGTGDGGPATQAALEPRGVAVDGAGNLVIADTGHAEVRVVAASTGTFYGIAMKAGYIYDVAGDGRSRPLNDGGPATKAGIFPEDVAVDGAGNLVVTDGSNNRVRVVAARTDTFYGQKMAAGDIYSVAGDGRTGFAGDGGPATQASLHIPEGVAVDGTGDLVIADVFHNRVRVVAARTGTFYGQKMTVGDIYTVGGDGSLFYSGDSDPATSALLNVPGAVALDHAGNLVIGDGSNCRVRVVAAAAGRYYGKPMKAGHIYSVAGDGKFGYAGDGGPAGQAKLSIPSGVAVDGAGNLVIADSDNQRVRVVAARDGTFYGEAMQAGNIYTVAGNGTSGYSGGRATSAELASPRGVTLDAAGNLVLADTGNNMIRVVAASTGRFYGQPMQAGYIYVVAGTGTDGFTGDGGPATQAELSRPGGVAVDAAGNLVIADTSNGRVRVVAATTGTFYGVAMTAGDIYTVAGGGTSLGNGPAADAELEIPQDATVDAAGNLVIADTGNNMVRVVAVKAGTFYGVAMRPGDIYTVAGDDVLGYGGDGGAAIHARLHSPYGVAVNPMGNLLVADLGNNRIRMVTGGRPVVRAVGRLSSQ